MWMPRQVKLNWNRITEAVSIDFSHFKTHIAKTHTDIEIAPETIGNEYWHNHTFHNLQVINLVGPPLQQDIELSALFNDAELTYGTGKVLGILATKTSDHEMRKRAVPIEENASSTASPTTTIPATEPPTPESSDDDDTDFTYYPTDNSKNQTVNILMHTRSAPILIEGKTRTVLNDKRTMITINRNKQNNYILKVRYNNQDKVSEKKIGSWNDQIII